MAVKFKVEKKNFPMLERSFELNRDDAGAVRGLNEEKRTVRVQFASETPVKRWFGEEILDCSAACVDMSRVQAGAAVLMEHDTSQRCGITESGNVTSGKTVEAEIRFARTPAGDSAMAEVKDGTLRWISVGYRVEKFEVDENEEEYRAVRWTPLEVSFVAIPADPTAKVLRSNQTEHPVMFKRSINCAPADTTPAHPADTDAAPELDEDGNPIERTDADIAARAETEAEIREVYALGHKWEKQYPGSVEKAGELVTGGVKMLEQMRGYIMERQATKPPDWEVINGAPGNPKAGGNRTLSFGEAFCKTRQYQSVGKDTGSKRTIICEMPDRLQFRATFSATTEALTSINKLPGVPGILDQQPLMVADLFAQGTTNALTVRYLIEDAFTNAAAAVAEGAAKPEATLNVSEVDATVRKVAVLTKVTDEMLSDFEQISSYINARLAYMVQAKEDNYLLNGTGANNQIKGVLNFAGIQTVAVGGAVTALDAIMKAIAYVRGANSVGFGEPDAVIINPLNWLSLKTAKDLNNQYYGGGPFTGSYGQGRYSNVGDIWGMPAVITNSIAAGTALVGSFKMAAQIFRRKGLTVESTNSNEDDFKNNLVCIRAEERLALAVYQPNKFCTVTGL